MKTAGFLKWGHGENLPIFGKNDFKSFRFVSISDLFANQEFIDSKVLNIKLSGKNMSVCYVVEFNEKKILIDGHHTVIAKKLNGLRKVKAMFLNLNTFNS